MKLLKITDAAAELQIPAETVRYWIKKGRIRTAKLGRHVRIRREDLDRFIDANSRVGTSVGTPRSRRETTVIGGKG